MARIFDVIRGAGGFKGARIMSIHNSKSDFWKSNYNTLSIVGFILSIYLLFFYDKYIDDAYITLAYAKNLAHSGIWGMAPDHISNAATSPLSVVILAGLIFIFKDPVFSMYAFQVCVAVATFIILEKVATYLKTSRYFSIICLLLLYSNPLLVSTLGLESYLLIMLTLLGFLFYLEKKYYFLGIMCGALFMARPDGLLFSMVLFLVVLVRREWVALRFVAPAIIVLSLWSLFSWFYFGSLIPDTLFIKRNQTAWDGRTFGSGLILYLEQFPVATSLAFLPVVSLICFLKRTNPNRDTFFFLFVGFASIHFISYSLMRVPPYHWYYANLATLGVLFGSLIISDHMQKYFRFTSLLVAALVFASICSVIGSIIVREAMPLNTNWGPVRQYRQIANWINDNIPDARMRIKGELGVIQFYTNTNMIDEFSDRALIARRRSEHDENKFWSLIKEINFRNFNEPDVSGIRYVLASCDLTVRPLMKWTTTSPWIGRYHWCLFEYER